MAHRAKLTPEKKREFLTILSQTCNVTKAAQALGIARRTAYDHRESDPEFLTAWDNAIEEAVDLLEQEAQRRAFNGTQRPVFHQGAQCGVIQEYSDTLAIFLLKAHRPKKYRERSSVEHSGPNGGPIAITDADTERARGKVGKLLDRLALVGVSAPTSGANALPGDNGDTPDGNNGSGKKGNGKKP